MSIEAQIQQLVDAFVSDITKLARQTALDTLAGALTTTAAAPRRGNGVVAKISPAAAPATRRRRKGEKRASTDITSLQKTLLDYVRSHPGERVEQINKSLGTSTTDVRLPFAKLIESGEVKTKGSRRATKYFPA